MTTKTASDVLALLTSQMSDVAELAERLPLATQGTLLGLAGLLDGDAGCQQWWETTRGFWGHELDELVEQDLAVQIGADYDLTGRGRKLATFLNLRNWITSNA